MRLPCPQLPRHPLGVALANAAGKLAAGSTPKKSAPPPPPPPPPARAAGAPPPPPPPPKPPTSAAHHPSVHDLAGGLARLRAVQQQQPAPAAAAPPAPVPARPALLVVDPHALARARAGLRKTGAAAAAAVAAAAVTPTRRGTPVQPAGGATPTSSRKRQATPPPAAAAAGTPRSALKRLRGTAEPCAVRALALPPSAQKAVAWLPHVELQSAETRAVERTQAVDLMEDQVPDATEVLAVLPPAFAQPRRQAAASAAPLRAAAVPAPSPTSLGLPAWMLQSAAVVPAAERVTPLRTHARSGARREPAAIAGEQPDAASVAAQLLAARGALRRTKALLRASRHQTQLLERALAVAAAAAPMEVLEASASEDAELGGSRVVVCTSAAAPADAARPEGAVRAGSVVVVYAQRAVPPPLSRPAAAAAIVVVAAVPRPLPPAPSPARIVPPWMFKAPKAALVEASSPMPAWLFSPGYAAGGCGAGARAVLGPSPAALAASNVTPRSAQRRKSMAQRAATAAEQHEPEEPECPPVALRFSQPEEGPAPAPLPLALALLASPPALRPPACAPLRLEATAGADLVGRRVVVWWSLDAAWYPGCIEAFAVRSKKHTVLYDDGEKETISLIKGASPVCRLVPALTRPTPCSERARRGCAPGGRRR